MRRLNKKTTVFIIIICIIIIIIWYRAPVKRSITTTLCSLDGEQISIDFDLCWQKYILKPTEIRGTIKLNNIIYYHVNDTNYKLNQGGFRDRLTNKLNNYMNVQWFMIPTNNPLDIHANNIQILHMDKNFETICIYVMTDSKLNVYYGPAKTAEEAKLISLEINK